MKFKIGDLSRGQREEMFNLHACYVNPEAIEQAFYLSYVPIKTIDLTAIPEHELYPLNKEQIESYHQLSKNPSTRYPVISGTSLIDGLHRISAEKALGAKTMEVLDFGRLLNPELSGKQFDIKFINQKQRI